MVTYVLEASSVLRLIDREAGQQRVADIVQQHLAGTANAVISALHWGEILSKFFKRYGTTGSNAAHAELELFQLIVIPATRDRAARSAAINTQYKVPFVDSFAVELAEHPECVLVMADFDYIPLQIDIDLEFLPPNTKP